MHADVVTEPAQYGPAVDAFDAMLTEYSFLPGNKYAEWKEGEPIAAYGLVGLIAGAGAVKLGLFGKLWKLILGAFIALKKFLIVILVAVGAFFKKLFSGKKEAPPAGKPVTTPPNAYPAPADPAEANKPRPSYRIR